MVLGELELRDLTLSGANALGSGGAIRLSGGGRLWATRVAFVACAAAGDGVRRTAHLGFAFLRLERGSAPFFLQICSGPRSLTCSMYSSML